jgi:hypothetical protein
MTVDRMSPRTAPSWSEHDPAYEGQSHADMADMSDRADMERPALPTNDGPLQSLGRSKSLPSSLEPSSAGAGSASRPRRRVGRSVSPTRGERLAIGRRDGEAAAGVAADEPARIPAVGERRSNIENDDENVNLNLNLNANINININENAGEPALPNAGGTWSSSALRAAKSFAKMSDVRTLLSRADDQAFIASLRAPSIESPDTGARLDRLTDHIAELKTRVGEAGLDDSLAERFKTRLDEIGDTLNALRTDQPLSKRALKVVGLNVLLAPLPLLIPLMTRPRQQKTEAEIAALMAKAMVEGIGMIRTPTTDNNLLIDRAMARYYANMVQAVEFALPTFVSSLRFLNANAAFNVAAGALSTGALFGGFLRKDIREKYNRWRSGSAHPGLHLAGLALSTEAKAALEAVRVAVETDRNALNETKAAFIANGTRELSPHVSKQVAIAVNAYQRIADELADCIGLPPAQTPAENRDRSAKLALALFSTAVCVGTTVLMLPDKIGTVDLASDAAFTSALMFSLMADSNVSRKDALEEFKTFVGLSLVMLGVLAANKAANDFIEHGVSGLLIGSIAMTALNLTTPGPVGHAAAQAIETLMNMQPPDLIAGLKNIGHRVYQMFAGQAQPQGASSVRIEELPPDLEAGLPA